LTFLQLFGQAKKNKENYNFKENIIISRKQFTQNYNMITNLTRILTTRNNGQNTLQDLNYTFDAVGNITQIRDDAQQTHYFNNQVIVPTSTFEYDTLYRLISATGRELTALTAPTHEDFPNNIPVPNPAANAMQNYNHSYSYDALGNILSDNWKTYQYDTETNYLLGNNNIANQYTYDQHGNMLSMPHLSLLQWNYKDELISAGNGTFTSYYSYDNEGNRTRKVVEKGNIIETRYYIGGYEVYRKFANNTQNLERTSLSIYDIKISQKELPKKNENDKPVMVTNYEIDTYNRTVLIETKTVENGQPVLTPVTNIRYQYSNHLGSACLELDEQGQIISYEEYHPFGTTSYRSGRTEIEVSLKRYKYCGKEKDEETGLYYFSARFYAPCICRFTTVDPLQNKYPEINPYAYCNNNPVKFIDPNGMDWKTSEDKNKAKALMQKATEQKENKQQVLENLKTIENPRKTEINQMSNLQKEIAYLENGIANLTSMGEDKNEKYHFVEVIGEGGVLKREDGILNIEHSTEAMAWHETVHIGDYRENSSEWRFNNHSYLGTSDKNFSKSEMKAYSSQFAFDNNSLQYTNGTRVTKLDEVRQWVQFHKFDQR
jgi:RHS repeat-associated protein